MDDGDEPRVRAEEEDVGFHVLPGCSNFQELGSIQLSGN